MRLVFVACRKEDVLQAFCCLRQVDRAFAHAQSREPEIRKYIRSQRAYYRVPPFSDTNYLESGGRAAEFDQVFAASQKQWRRYGLLLKIVAFRNRYRADTYLINALTVRMVQCGFRQIEAFLKNDTSALSEAEIAAVWHEEPTTLSAEACEAARLKIEEMIKAQRALRQNRRRFTEEERESRPACRGGFLAPLL